MKVKVNGLNINYIVDGNNNEQTVLIVHGWGANINTVKPIVNMLKHNYQVYAIDLPGHGESDKPTTVYGTKEFSEVISNFIDVMNLDKVIYIGHSFGGKCGIYLTANGNNKIDRLILVDASGIKPVQDSHTKRKIKKFKILKSIYITLFGEKSIDKFYKKFGSSDYRSADGVMRNILVKVVNEDLIDIIDKIDVETLLIWGRNDEDTPLYMAELMKSKIPNSRLVVLEGGHYSYLDDAIGFKKAVLEFL